MSVSISYAETDSSVYNATNATSDTNAATNTTTIKTKYINTFQEDYTKPRPQDNKNQTMNASMQNVTNATNQSDTPLEKDLTPEEIDRQFKEKYKVLISK